MYHRGMNVLAVVVTTLLMVVSGTLAADTPAKTFPAKVEFANASAKTITLQVESPHDITAFMHPGDTVEVVKGTNGTTRSYSATVESVDTRPKTVRLKVNSVGDVTALMRSGDAVEVAVGGTAAATPPAAKAFQAKIESVDARTKTVTMHVESIHDITAFMHSGKRVEIIVAE